MRYVLIALIAIPVGAACRAVFRRHGVAAFAAAWFAFVGSFYGLLSITERLLASGIVATLIAFLSVWGLSRAHLLPDV
jgi:hypothetical protein